ncbi:hypothetical protein [Conexibacter woesei]|uniref:DUF5666 domain-containing protein n=1 Tax=Conexibacter woesei (strain DSM 14684 / CCUG 47730 / CIP 108061 / JCM 11494 / NBRC 100937 / ID131577) TaxID=469383 RepID=D3F916_CONWI|nr:hypothetical protein [Conexibacter woesei]ADB53011.1 hypothetical protein Cwoe_4598 [Conexibacter woesei DSM 14684]
MDARNGKRITQIALVALALVLGTVTATALARDGADDGTGTTGTTGTTQTGTTQTTPQPGVTPLPGRKIRVVGTVSARDEAARTFTLTVKRRTTRTFTVRSGRVPAVDSFVLVKGRRLDDGTIQASRVKLLRGCHDDDDDVRGRAAHRGHDDDHCDDRRGRGDDDRGRGRDDDDRGDDDRGRGRGDDD